jgi:DNA-binding NtrC family response regulator
VRPSFREGAPGLCYHHRVSQEHTLRQSFQGLPVRTLRVEVTAGPDQGKSATAQEESLSLGTASDNQLVLSDATVSRYHVELRSRADGVEVIDHGSTNGTFVQGVRIERGVVPAGTVLTLGRTQLRAGEGEEVRVALFEDEQLGQLCGRTAGMRRVMAQVQKAAQSDVPVLVIGESGTGKEVIARSLHELGPRAKEPLVTVDCGALTPTLVASELFGHEKGAFTGADRQHLGAFERAHGGTLFLDEIGELPQALQPTLLGVLERRRFRRLGGKQDISIDVRVLSATHRDLREEVNAGTFRLDLFYRLAVIRLSVPPLRERKDDIPLLVEHFLREAGHDGPIADLISDAAMQQLVAHRWPGNVRELRNLIEATLAMGEPPQVDDLGRHSEPGMDAIAPLLDLQYKDARGALLEQFEKRYLEHWLAKTAGNVSKAARDARIDRSHLNDLLRRHQLR